MARAYATLVMGLMLALSIGTDYFWLVAQVWGLVLLISVLVAGARQQKVSR